MTNFHTPPPPEERCLKCGKPLVKEPDGERWCPACDRIVEPKLHEKGVWV